MAKPKKSENTTFIFLIIIAFIFVSQQAGFQGSVAPPHVSTSPLRGPHDLTGIDVSGMSNSYVDPQAIKIELRPFGTSLVKGTVFLGSGDYTDGDSTAPGAGKAYSLRFYYPVEDLVVNAGDTLKLLYADGSELTVYLPFANAPANPVASKNYFISEDGSTYYNLDYTNFAAGPPGEQCVPQCSGFECGRDGCGGFCGFCGQGFTCQSNSCIADACVPKTSCGSCTGPFGLNCEAVNAESACSVTEGCQWSQTAVCGDESDGCGGFVQCGVCGAGESCNAGMCEAASACTVDDITFGWVELNQAINKWVNN